ncbi:threonine ammonia-lyase [Gemelliphila asaccharolytica]|uniref:L-threonine dehydratase catabolic TdcB n=1 Tax=Gemelliphila asaccharolytica TaxID=502393 RepID=A0ABR5TKP4_9BACL|nr:threonine ammonia-lyase [Gemella asaccharolytica]KXB56311.1 threonine ammonia-lyase [Gemella asaccharolytica]
MFDFNSAKKRVDKVINKTHLIYSQSFSEQGNNNIYIKPENLQKTGAFKLRGAYNKLSKLDRELAKKGIITASAGNHAQGVAFSAKKLGMKAVICMPEHTPMIKVEGTLKYGAEVVLYGDSFDACKEHSLKLAKEKGYTFIPPFDDLDVIEGQGTIGLEIIQELKNVDYIIVPVGGGGLISGISKCIKEISPLIKIIGVEPYSARSMKESIKRGKIVTLDGVDTIADGTAVAKVGKLNYKICKENVDDWITVTDEEILMAFIKLIEKHKLVAEPSGCLSLAAIDKLNFFNKNVVCVVSGGNIDMAFISQLINKGLYATGQITRIEIEIANIPGKLQELLTLIAKTKANVISITHDGFKRASRFKNIRVKLTLETNGKEHAKKIEKILLEKGYILH